MLIRFPLSLPFASHSGFPPHSHASYEIFSYVLSGELTHRDSMGNLETLKRGEIQYTRAGTGIKHSEYNNQKGGAGTHFMQVSRRHTGVLSIV